MSATWLKHLATLAVGVACAAPAFARGDADQEFKDWWVACDNVRVCTAYGFPPDEGTGLALRVRRAAEAGAAPRLDLIVSAADSEGVTGALSLDVDGRVLGATKPPEDAEEGFRTWDVTGVLTVSALLDGQRLDAKVGDRSIGTVSLAGVSAALRWMDDRQKRAGGVTALVARGAAPAAAVPPPPPLPRIRAAAPVDQEGLTDTPPPTVAARIRRLACEIEDDGPVSSRLAPGVVLWVVPCWQGAYNVTSVLILANEKGDHVRLADLTGRGDPNGRAQTSNASYDADSRRLYSYERGPGLGECGLSQAWAWTGQGFVLAERSELIFCHGLSATFWVDTYRTR